MKKIILVAFCAAGLAGCAETKWNAAPSVFPPIEGPSAPPTQAQGFYQGTGIELARQLSDFEQQVYDELSPSQQRRALIFIMAGGTLYSSFGSDI